MPLDRAHLHELLVYLECADAQPLQPDPVGYQRAAHALRQAILNELAEVPMLEFVHGDLPALQTIVQNVFFESRGRFADLDGSGSAQRAAEMGQALIDRSARRR